MGISFWHILTLLIVVFLVFGTKKLRNVGSDLGHAIKGFREAMHDNTQSNEDTAAAGQKPAPHSAEAAPAGRVIEAEVRREETPSSSPNLHKS